MRATTSVQRMESPARKTMRWHFIFFPFAMTSHFTRAAHSDPLPQLSQWSESDVFDLYWDTSRSANRLLLLSADVIHCCHHVIAVQHDCLWPYYLY